MDRGIAYHQARDSFVPPVDIIEKCTSETNLVACKVYIGACNSSFWATYCNHRYDYNNLGYVLGKIKIGNFRRTEFNHNRLLVTISLELRCV